MRYLAAASLFFVLFGCASGLKQSEFHATHAPQRGKHGTVLLFLVDGLAVRTLRTGLDSGATPNLGRFFLRGKRNFALGQAAFPTQTYPNISSILTARPVGDQPVLANHVLSPSGKILAYENVSFFPQLRATIDPLSVIGTLNRDGRETASFSYVFGLNATDHMLVGVREGLEYEQHHYRSLDARLLENLEKFLAERGSPGNWPDFIYVHLVGVDGTSHRYGPDSPETRAYLAWLDARLGPVLARLERAEKKPGADIVTLLTADHGFVSTRRYVPVAKLVRKADLGTVILNEGRFLALHLPEGRGPRELAPVLREARAVRGVGFTALRDGNLLEIARGRNLYRFALGPPLCDGASLSLALLPPGANALPAGSFRCPSDFDELRSANPFLVDGIARYLTAPNHPDALILAETSVSFSPGMAGNHGGASAEESLVPVLLRNAELRGGAPVRTSDLLKLVVPTGL
jgi:hypothetical protein